MKRFLIAGNWKMNTVADSASKLAKDILQKAASEKTNVDILVCPPFINIPAVYEEINSSFIKVGAQNCHPFENGAFTGEISIPMLKQYGIEYIIVGHSERRELFHEDNTYINKKVQSIIESGLNVILCIGESLHERQTGQTFTVLSTQLNRCLGNIDIKYYNQITIAYEPIWAIGTGVSADLFQIEEAHGYIREQLMKLYDKTASQNIKILYGGSVNRKNSKDILRVENVDGGLIGGASLDADTFVTIVNNAEEI